MTNSVYGRACRESYGRCIHHLKVGIWKVRLNNTRELYLLKFCLGKNFSYSLDRHLWKALFWSGWGGRNKDLWHMVPRGCQALQTSVTEYHQTMELHVQATSYWSCHEQVSRLSVLYWSCHSLLSPVGIYNPFSSRVKQNWEVLNTSIECVWVIKSWSMKLGNSFTSVFVKISDNFQSLFFLQLWALDLFIVSRTC